MPSLIRAVSRSWWTLAQLRPAAATARHRLPRAWFLNSLPRFRATRTCSGLRGVRASHRVGANHPSSYEQPARSRRRDFADDAGVVPTALRRRVNRGASEPHVVLAARRPRRG